MGMPTGPGGKLLFTRIALVIKRTHKKTATVYQDRPLIKKPILAKKFDNPYITRIVFCKTALSNTIMKLTAFRKTSKRVSDTLENYQKVLFFMIIIFRCQCAVTR